MAPKCAKSDLMALEYSSYFFKKLQKIAQRLLASPPDFHNLRWLGAQPPDSRL